jgi:hypothetical protein
VLKVLIVEDDLMMADMVGMSLVDSVEQVRGTATVASDHGSVWTLRFSLGNGVVAAAGGTRAG